MLYSPDRNSKLLKFTVAVSFSAALVVSPLALAAEEPGKEKLDAAPEKTVTLKGKLASNGGIPLLENAEIVKK